MAQTKKTPDPIGLVSGRTYVGVMEILNPPEPIAAHRKSKAGTRHPNDLTRQTIKDAAAGKGVVRCKDASDLFRKLGL